MPAGGLHGQLGLKAEATYGTAVTVDRFYELVSEEITTEFARVPSSGIRSGQLHARSDDWTTGLNRVSGGIDLEMSTKNMALLFRHALGSVSTAGAGPYTHTITPGSKQGLGLTIQVGRPGSAGTVHPFTFEGCKIVAIEVSFELDQPVQVRLEIVGQSQTTATALATASYTASNALLAYTHGAITLGGSAVKVKSGSWRYETPMNTDRVFLGDDEISEPLENGQRVGSFSLECEFEDLTVYNRVVNGTEAALSLSFTRSTDSITIAGNVRCDSGTPVLDGMDLLDVTIEGQHIATAADSTAVTVTVVSGEATP